MLEFCIVFSLLIVFHDEWTNSVLFWFFRNFIWIIIKVALVEFIAPVLFKRIRCVIITRSWRYIEWTFWNWLYPLLAQHLVIRCRSSATLKLFCVVHMFLKYLIVWRRCVFRNIQRIVWIMSFQICCVSFANMLFNWFSLWSDNRNFSLRRIWLVNMLVCRNFGLFHRQRRISVLISFLNYSCLT